MIVLVNNGITHHCIHKWVDEDTNFYEHLASNFQIMISNGGMMKREGHYENVKLQFGDTHLKIHMFKWLIWVFMILFYGLNGYEI